jgi:hypothetical protein
MRPRPSRLRAARVAIAGLIAFVAIAAAEHVLEPQLAPSRHQISEYANSDTGALMVAGLLAWGVSLFATACVVWRDRGGRPGAAGHVVLAALLVVAGTGIVLTAAFATQTSAGALPPGTRMTTSGRIHDLASGAATLALLGGVVTSIVALRMRARFSAFAAWLLVLSLAAAAILLAVGDPVDGVRQRLLVVVGCIWQGTLVLALERRHRP